MSRVGYLPVSVSKGLLQVLWSELNSGLNSSVMFLQVLPIMSQYMLEYLGILQNISRISKHRTGSGFPTLDLIFQS